MRNIVVLGIVFGIVGLVVGYLIFGRAFGELVPIVDIFRPAGNLFEQLGEAVRGIEEMRQNILISGGVGLVCGVVLGILLNKR